MRSLVVSLVLVAVVADTVSAKCTSTIDCSNFSSTNSRFYTHPIDCAKSYKCVNGKARIYYCPSDQYFSEELQSCAPSQEVTCSRCDEEINEEEEKEEIPRESFDCNPEVRCEKTGTSSGFFSHPADCGKSYRCSNGKPVVLSCPNGNHFSEELQKCVPAGEDTCTFGCVI